MKPPKQALFLLFSSAVMPKLTFFAKQSCPIFEKSGRLDGENYWESLTPKKGHSRHSVFGASAIGPAADDFERCDAETGFFCKIKTLKCVPLDCEGHWESLIRENGQSGPQGFEPPGWDFGRPPTPCKPHRQLRFKQSVMQSP